jgi:hypothetical protein
MSLYWRFLLVAGVLFCASTQAFAVLQVSVRTRSFPKQQQLQFVWPQAVGYTLTQINDKMVVISFDRSGRFVAQGAGPLKWVPGPGNNQQVTIQMPEAMVVRDFRKGNSIFLDFFPNQPKPVTPSPLANKPAPKVEDTPPATSAPKVTLAKQASVTTMTADRTGLELVLADKSGMVVFERARKFYVIVDPAPEGGWGGLPAQVAGVSAIRAADNATLEIIAEPGFQPVIRRDGKKWSIHFDTTLPVPSQAVVPEMLNTDGLKSITIPLDKVWKQRTWKDPLTGKTFHLILTESDKSGCPERFEMPQVCILVSALGLVIDKIDNQVQIVAGHNNVIINSPDGLKLSSEGERSRSHPTIPSPPVYLFEEWAGSPEEMLVTQGRLEAEVLEAAPTQRTEPRLALARFLFANGLLVESQMTLGFIKAADPLAAESFNFLALQGAIALLLKEYTQAQFIFSKPMFDDEPEIQLWLALARLAGQGDVYRLSRLVHYRSMWAKYPHFVSLRFLIPSTEAALKANQIDDAAQLLQVANEIAYIPPFDKAMLTYLDGLLRLKGRDAEGAQKIWEKLYQTQSHTPGGILAELECMQIDLVKGKRTLHDVIQRLESLRYSWRGDALEHKVCERLIDAYWRSHQFRAAIDLIRERGKYYPLVYPKEEIETRLRSKLEEVLDKDGVGLFTLLALVKDYRHLLPETPKTDARLKKLINGLIEVGHNKQGLELMEPLIAKRLQGLEKSEMGVKAARAYLEEGQPQKALDILSATSISGSPLALHKERKHLEARALGQLQRWSEAILVVSGDETQEGLRLRRDLYLAGQQWSDAVQVLGDILNAQKPAADHLTSEQVQLVMDMAVAAGLTKNQNATASVREKYKQAMDKTIHATLFDLITYPVDAQDTSVESVKKQTAQADYLTGLAQAYAKNFK